jgi:predicted O-methyltransferase YrrM
MIESILDEKKIDFLFIDGDHTYEGVKKDFKMYSPLVKDGRIIAFHDIVSGPQNLVGGVPQFWQEIKKKYKYLEIVEDWNQRGYGIGVIYKNSIKDQ